MWRCGVESFGKVVSSSEQARVSSAASLKARKFLNLYARLQLFVYRCCFLHDCHEHHFFILTTAFLFYCFCDVHSCLPLISSSGSNISIYIWAKCICRIMQIRITSPISVEGVVAAIHLHLVLPVVKPDAQSLVSSVGSMCRKRLDTRMDEEVHGPDSIWCLSRRNNTKRVHRAPLDDAAWCRAGNRSRYSIECVCLCNEPLREHRTSQRTDGGLFSYRTDMAAAHYNEIRICLKNFVGASTAIVFVCMYVCVCDWLVLCINILYANGSVRHLKSSGKHSKEGNVTRYHPLKKFFYSSCSSSSSSSCFLQTLAAYWSLTLHWTPT